MTFDRWIGVLGLVAALISIVVAIRYARQSRQAPVLASLYDFDILMSPNKGIARDALSLAYADQRIERVSRTYVALWSKAGDTARGTDVVESDPLRIEVGSDDTILQIEKLCESRVQCGLTLTLDRVPTQALLNFDYLDRGDGLVVEVIHTGESPARVAGTLRGTTIVTPRPAELSPPALELVAYGGRWKRTLLLLRRRGSAFNRVRSVAIYILLLSCLAFLGMAAYDLYNLLSIHAPALIDPHDYNLSTLAGQRRFSRDVSKHNPGLSKYADVFTEFLICGLFFFMLAKVAGAALPRTLLGHTYFASQARGSAAGSTKVTIEV